MSHPRTERSRLAAVLLAAAILVPLPACGTSGPTATGEPGPALQISEAIALRLSLREQGIELQFRETVEEPLLLPTLTDRYTYDGEDVRLYGFASPEAAEGALETISEDGRTVDGEPLPWSGPPHFYHHQRLIVLHVGTNGELRQGLTSFTGGQVAGE